MRIDRFLHFIRLAKSRSQAQIILATGHVRIDGRRAGKSIEEVKPGQVVAVPINGMVRVLRIVAIPARRGPASEARACYDELLDSTAD